MYKKVCRPSFDITNIAILASVYPEDAICGWDYGVHLVRRSAIFLISLITCTVGFSESSYDTPCCSLIRMQVRKLCLFNVLSRPAPSQRGFRGLCLCLSAQPWVWTVQIVCQQSETWGIFFCGVSHTVLQEHFKEHFNIWGKTFCCYSRSFQVVCSRNQPTAHPWFTPV